MTGWPGDTQSGGFFINNKLVLINSDGEISSNNHTPKELINRIPPFEHIRGVRCTYDNDDLIVHDNCLKLKDILNFS